MATAPKAAPPDTQSSSQQRIAEKGLEYGPCYGQRGTYCRSQQTRLLEFRFDG